MQIEQINPNKLKPAEYNPRKMSEKEVKDLTESIRKFGLVEPIVVNKHEGRENVVVGGHQRLKIAQSEGFTEIPVVYVDLDEKSERELNLRLNKNLGSWDWEMLANFGEEELKETGFTSEELDKAFGLVEEDSFDAEAEYQKIEEPKTKSGDLYFLGEHRLLCGDSTKKESYEKLFAQGLKPEARAQMIFTDPPYNVNYDYAVRYFDGRKKKHNKIFNDDKKSEEFSEFLLNVFKNCFFYSKDNSSFYCWHATKNDLDFKLGILESGWHISQVLIWLKENITFSTGQDYHRIYEPCFFGWKKGNKHFSNKKGNGNLKEIIELNNITFGERIDLIYQNRDRAKDYIHPTQKPIRLAERALKYHSSQGDIILEPFNGSGSTMMACEQLKRKCYAIELDPKFVDVAILRWEAATGQKAIKVG